MAADLLNERLPPDWSYGVTGDGRVFFISERHRETSWLHPVTGRPVQTGHQAAPGLPNGWEQDFTPEGATYFIDHNNQQTTFGHPVTGRPVSEENPPPPPSSPPQSPNDRSDLRRGTTNAKQRSIKAPSAKRNPNAQVVRRGFLYRLESGGISKAWKRRWCVLADFALFIYKSDDEKTALGSVLLPSYRINRCTSEDPVQKEFAFKVEHENTKTVYFHTDTQTDLDSWLSNLQMAATMKGGSGFNREANNNNIKPGPAGMGQRSPPYADQRGRSYPDSGERSPQHSNPGFHPQWRNPNPHQHTIPGGTGPPRNSLSGQPSWRSVPDLERDSRGPQGPREVEYDPQGSLRSLPQEVHRNLGMPAPNLRQDSRNLPHHQSYDPRQAQQRVGDRDPRGSVHSLQADPAGNRQDFGHLGPSAALGRDRGSQSGFQPYQRPNDPQQRTSMVSDTGRHGDPRRGQGSPQRSPQEAHTSQGGIPGGHQPHYPPQDRNGSFPPTYNRQTSDSSARERERSRDSWQGSNAGPSGMEPQPRGDYSRGYPDPNRGYPERDQHAEASRERFYPDTNPQLNSSRDPRASYASSRHSLASQGYNTGDRDSRGSKQNLFPHHGSRSSLSQPQPPTTHPPPHHPPPHHPVPQHPVPLNAQGHTYVNIPQMRSAAQRYDDSPPPERPPYPVAARDQLVRDLAETRSPGTAEKLLTALELNKERMQRSPYFQYPTPPRNSTVSRLDNSQGSDPAKRLSQYSDRNSLASNSTLRNEPGNTTGRSPRGSSNDYSDGGRRQDSGSGRFSDSFERRSADERRGEDAGRNGQSREGGRPSDAPLPVEMQFGGDPEAKSLRQAYERVQSFRQSSAADGGTKPPNASDLTRRDSAKLGEGYCYVFLPGSESPGAAGDAAVPETAPPGDVNFFQHSLSSQASMGHSWNYPVFTDRPAPESGDQVKPQFSLLDRLGSADPDHLREDLEVSHNTTLSPSGSYHHIDRDLDQLYMRGSAFRPPSSAAGSVGGDGLFHSLPRSYKFKSIPDAWKGSYMERSSGSNSRTLPSKGGDGGGDSDGDWEWYKANYLSPSRWENKAHSVDQRSWSQKHLRSRSDLGFDRFQSGPKPFPANEKLTDNNGEMFAPAKPKRSAFYRDDFDWSLLPSHPDWKYNGQGPASQGEPLLHSWPRQELTARELDVPTPTSLSSHPFFVPEEAPLSPSPPPSAIVDGESLTPRSQMDKKLREDLDEGVYAKLKAREGMNRRPIQTVREEPDMPDDEVLETKLQKKYPLNGTRLRMSISAGDLIGKTHDELVLLLIQLRRNQSALEKARDFYRESLSKRRPVEREYRKQRHDSVGRLERSLEEGHQSFVDTRSQLEEVEKKLDVYRPLINLVDNMVTMGSLYGGDNLMLATQYRKHLLRPDQYQAPRKMLEFSRQYQEERVVASIENDVRQLSATEVDLEEKIDRLNQLEHLLQEQSFKVSSFREDKELLEKALQGIMQQLREGQDSPRDVRRLQQQQASVEKELSRVTQELAEASKALEETTVENNKIEHEVALLRTKVHGEMKRSKSAPSLTTDSTNAKVKMERELARVQNMLQGLSQQGEKLSQQMSTIRRSSSGTQLAAAFDEAEKSRKVGTYMQTDLDSGDQVDLAQQIPVQSPGSPASLTSPGASTDRPIISHQRQESTHGVNSSMSEGDSRADWDIGDADDNTKRFYGLLPREKPRGLTVRDVKRQSEQRRERKRDEEGQDLALKVSSTDDDTSTFIHARYPSYASSQSSGLDLSARDPHDPSAPLYENLPRSGSMPALNQSGSSAGPRRLSINLISPKPFTPYQDRTAKPFKSELALNTNDRANEVGQGGGAFVVTKPFASEMALNSGWNGDALGLHNGGLNHEPLVAGQVGMVTARPLHTGQSADNIADLQQPGLTGSSALPTYTRVPQPFRRDTSGVSQSTPHLYTPDTSSPSSLPAFTGVSRPNGENTSRVYAPRPWAKELSSMQPGLHDTRKTQKGRYMTVSSSQPSTMEPGALMNPTIHSAAGDLISNARVDDVPDVVKSSLNNVDKIDQIDEDMIDREILYFPEKVLIPERYDAEADAEQLTEAQKMERQEKADRIKRLLTNQSVLSMSQPDINHAPPGQLHNQVQREKQERAHILTLNQELARQVTQQSKKAAAERRKTWSGGQIADIKAQYEAELAGSPGQSDRVARQANVLL